jgi:phosphonate transport system substrate-binding protein
MGQRGDVRSAELRAVVFEREVKEFLATMTLRETIKQRLLLGLAGWALVAAGGCARPAAAERKEPADGAPKVLRVGYAPSEEAVVGRERAMRTLGVYLEKRLGVPVELVQTASYGPAVDALTSGAVDLVSLTPFAYVLAAEGGVAEPLVVTGSSQGGPRTYQSAIVTHRRTGLERLEDLAERAAHLRFNFTDPASNSGHLVPRARLAGLGLDAEKDFARTEFTLSHNVSVMNVEFGLADVAGVSTTTLGRLLASGRVERETLVTLWVSDALPNGPIAVRSALPEGFKRSLREALLELPRVDPAANRVVMAQYQDEALVYVACDDSLYDGLREMQRRYGPVATVEAR